MGCEEKQKESLRDGLTRLTGTDWVVLLDPESRKWRAYGPVSLPLADHDEAIEVWRGVLKRKGWV